MFNTNILLGRIVNVNPEYVERMRECGDCGDFPRLVIRPVDAPASQVVIPHAEIITFLNLRHDAQVKEVERLKEQEKLDAEAAEARRLVYVAECEQKLAEVECYHPSRVLRALKPDEARYCDFCNERFAEFLYQGETDSFGCEEMHACKACSDPNIGYREGLVELIAEKGGHQDVDFFVGVLGNRDTVDEWQIVRGTLNAAILWLQLQARLDKRGDYAYSSAFRVATEKDHRTMSRIKAEQNEELAGWLR